MANSTTTSAIRPLNGMTPGLRRNDLLLEACQQQLSVGYSQTEIGDMAEIIRSVDLHNVDALLFPICSGFHQPHNPRHASTSGQRTDAKIPRRCSHPQTCDGPLFIQRDVSTCLRFAIVPSVVEPPERVTEVVPVCDVP